MTPAGRYLGIAFALLAVLTCPAATLAARAEALSQSASPYLQMHAVDAIR